MQTGCEQVEVYQAIGRGEDLRRMADMRHYRFDEAPTQDQLLSWEWAGKGISPERIREALKLARFIGGKQ